ncbi:GAF domain-containing protein [Azoarcus taiwanensis]|uniref:GAF domain-containing protein n=1 Tax=Azoarcus taiwanensis TaxID=666964 RepID=A0A972F5Q4_9RHOO|nr:GAF domain-containing protein [Azoarcus taiwanensis]
MRAWMERSLDDTRDRPRYSSVRAAGLVCRPDGPEQPLVSKAVKFRVHVFATIVLVAFVVSLTAAFLFSALGRFERMAEESAQAVFDRVADANAAQLSGLIDTAGRAVRVLASLERALYLPESGAMEPAQRLLAAFVASHEPIYGLYFGLDGGEFVQVIAVGGDRRIREALDAPPGTAFARRAIAREEGVRVERWEFVDLEGASVGHRESRAEYDPTERDWYRTARAHHELVLTEPYVFQSSGALGLTVARRIDEAPGVVGVDLSLAALSAFVAESVAGQPGGLLILDPAGRVLAFGGDASGTALRAGFELLAPLDHSGPPEFAALAEALGDAAGEISRSVSLDGQPYVLAVREVQALPGVSYRIAAFAPLSAFDRHIVRARDDIVLLSLIVLGLSLPLAFLMARQASGALASLARDSERVRTFDFSGDVRVDTLFYEIDVLGQAHRTMKESIHSRTEALSAARDQLQDLVNSGLALASRHERKPLLNEIVAGAMRQSQADLVSVWLLTEQDTLELAACSAEPAVLPEPLPLRDEHGSPATGVLPVFVAVSRASLSVARPGDDPRFDHDFLDAFDRLTACHSAAILALPMLGADGRVLGVLHLTREAGAFSEAIVPFCDLLAAQAGMALDNQNLLEGQRVLMDALIRIIAGAIDAKSPYTGGHCERVPELALMLAEAASKSDEGGLAGFRFDTEDQWREFRVGAWLHDCGKVTTPEFVVDKATKLETLYNRIHEIRTRFEVLLRDAEIAHLKTLVSGGDVAESRKTFAARRTKLIEDFAFVAACNIGGEAMDDADVHRLQRIGAQTWLRHFDDRIGLSHEEATRMAARPVEALPAREPLLADKPHHRVERPAAQRHDEQHGFRMAVPDCLYDFGELHNLSVRRGTLTPEERYKINEHIIQTILMLEKLPLPRQLRRVPEYAGTHHETLTGTGYPRRLNAEELSIPARIMAIADIFEALTAADRPYKTGKTLSESVAILAEFCDAGHIDAELFELFLRSGVYLSYAKRFLDPTQIDDVDIDALLEGRG